MRLCRKVLIYIVILIVFFATSKHYFVLAINSFTQNNWTDSATYSSSSNVVTNVANQITLSPNSNWFNLSWQYRQSVGISNASGSTLTDYQIPIFINTSALISASKMKADCSDLLVVDSVGTTLSYWIATSPSSNTCGQVTTKIWVKANSISTSGSNLYLYYGNSSAGSQSNGDNVFNTFADFTVGTSLPTNWTKTDIGTAGTYSVGGSLSISNTNGEDLWDNIYGATHIYKNSKISGSFTAEALVTSQSAANEWAKSGIVIQNSMASGASNGQAFIAVTPNNGVPFQYQSATTAEACGSACIAPNVNLGSVITSTSMPVFLKLTKNSSNLVSAYRSAAGIGWTQQGDSATPLGISADQYVSLFITPHNTSATGTATYTFFYTRKFSATEPIVNSPSNEEKVFVSPGTLTSSIFDTGYSSIYGNINYGVTIPTNTSATVKVRTSNNSDMSGATNFSSCNALSSNTDISSNNCVTDGHRYLQYQITLNTSDNLATPTFTNISIEYDPYILTVNFISPTLNNGTTINPGNSAVINVGVTSSFSEYGVVNNWNNSLVNWWKFNTDGEFSGATWTSSGKYGGAYTFNGSSNYIDMGVPVAAQIQNNLTMSAWIKTTDTSGGYKDIFANQWQYGESGIMLSIQGASTIHVPFSTATGTIDTLDATANFSDDNWHLISVTFASGTIKIYFDGVEKASKTSSTVTQIAYNNSNHLLIGKDSATSGVEYFNGSIDDVQLYNRVLSADEIGALYNANVDSGQIGYLGFNYNGDLNNATNIGASWTPSGKFGGAYSFDGNDNISIPDNNNLDGSTFTFSAWVNRSSAPFWDRLVSKKLNYNDTNGWEIALDSRASGDVYLGGSSGSFAVISCSTDSNYFTDSNWHHLVAIYSGSNVTLYCDGVDKGTATIASVVGNTNPLLIGKIKNEDNTQWHGLIDDVRIYNRALVQDEVTSLYTTHGNPYNTSFSPSSLGTYSYQFSAQDINGFVSQTISRNLVVANPSYTLTYSASTNGSINGISPQTVGSGESGSSVTPIANTNFHFTTWSDGSTAVPRIDSNVTQNIGVTANFAINTYTVNFLANDNGVITGTSSQTINHGSDSTSVTATANSGYHFTNWSDGSTANPRIIYNVVANQSVTANFAANDPNAPIISNITSTGNQISWTTDELASSQVQYGLNSSYGFSTSELDTSSRVLSHQVTLPDLKSCARYYYRVISKDATNNQTASAQLSFNTTGCAITSITSGIETTIPVTGGTFELVNNSSTAQLSVPNNYAAEQATFQINKLETTGAPTGPDSKSIANNNLYDLVAVTSSDQQLSTFSTPITFTISYGSDTETNFEESSLDVYKYDGSNWIKKGCTLNTTANTLTCSLTSFSTYGVLGTAKNNQTSSTSVSNSSSSSSSSSSGCTNSKPLSISDLFQINTTNKSAKIFFTPLSDTNKYFISFSTNPNAEEHGAEVTLAREGVQNFTVNLLKPNTIYYLKVRGQNGCMPGDWSNIMKFKTDSKIYYKNSSFTKKIIQPKLISKKTTEIIPIITESPKAEIAKPVVTPTPKIKKKCFLLWCW